MSASFYSQVLSSSFCFCFKLVYMGKKRTFRFSFLCDWYLFHNFLASFLFSVIAFNFYKIYSPIRSVILALHILSSCSWVSSSSSSVLHKLVNSERTTLFSSKHMRLLGIKWFVCVGCSVCMYVGKIE